ncbi:MAG: hypothetical protein AB7O96_16805, partial [Pseudobdellovibrionaceae bacterium]
MNCRKKFFLILFLASAIQVQAETLGSFRLESMSLGTEVESIENQNGGFDLKNSHVSFGWEKTESLSGFFAIGTSDLRKKFFMYPQTSSEIAITEMHLDLGTSLGTLKFGLIRIPFGYEGFLGEGRLLFPESQAKRMNFHTTADYGIQYATQTTPFFTTLSAHNGEGGSSKDPYVWFSGQWGIADEGGWKFLLSGTTGETSKNSAVGSTSPIAFNVLDKAKLREGALTFAYDRDGWQIVLEYLRGEIVQNSKELPYSISRLDFATPLSSYVYLLLRHEQLDPAIKTKNDETTWSTLGFTVESTDRLLKF